MPFDDEEGLDGLEFESGLEEIKLEGDELCELPAVDVAVAASRFRGGIGKATGEDIVVSVHERCAKCESEENETSIDIL